jgi:nicotinamidase-related amidase
MALLVMDLQIRVVAMYDADEEYLTRVRTAIDTARLASIPVIYVRLAFREGHPEVGRSNRIFSRIASAGAFVEGDPQSMLHHSVMPHPQDLVVTKRRISAFSGSDLELLLRSGAIETLVVCGIATSGVVLSTVRDAADRDFNLIVLADACCDSDDEVHRVLMQKVFTRQAEVLTVRDWVRRVDTTPV